MPTRPLRWSVSANLVTNLDAGGRCRLHRLKTTGPCRQDPRENVQGSDSANGGTPIAFTPIYTA
jgi:hypothetical protein